MHRVARQTHLTAYHPHASQPLQNVLFGLFDADGAVEAALVQAGLGVVPESGREYVVFHSSMVARCS